MISQLIGGSGSLLLGEKQTGKTSLCFSLCYEAAERGEHSLLLTPRFSFPLQMTQNSTSNNNNHDVENQNMKGNWVDISPGPLKRIALLRPDNLSHLLELLMQVSFYSKSTLPTVIVADGLSDLIDPLGTSSLSSDAFLSQCLKVLSHLFDLVSHIETVLERKNRVRVVITESRLKVDADHAYANMLMYFCERMFCLRLQTQTIPRSTIFVYRSNPAGLSSGPAKKRKTDNSDSSFSSWGRQFMLVASVELGNDGSYELQLVHDEKL